MAYNCLNCNARFNGRDRAFAHSWNSNHKVVDEDGRDVVTGELI